MSETITFVSDVAPVDDLKEQARQDYLRRDKGHDHGTRGNSYRGYDDYYQPASLDMRRGRSAVLFDEPDVQDETAPWEPSSHPWDYDDDGRVMTIAFSQYTPRLYHPDNERKDAMARVARTQGLAQLALARLEGGMPKAEVYKWFMYQLPRDEFERMQELSGVESDLNDAVPDSELASEELTNHFRLADRSRPVGRDYLDSHEDDVADWRAGVSVFTVE